LLSVWFFASQLFNKLLSICVPGDVFAGVGPIAVTAAKKVKYVYANDLNPSAIAYLHQNLVTNRLTHKVDVTILCLTLHQITIKSEMCIFQLGKKPNGH
jgi:methylase of polypeptide subunit release factors